MSKVIVLRVACIVLACVAFPAGVPLSSGDAGSGPSGGTP